MKRIFLCVMSGEGGGSDNRAGGDNVSSIPNCSGGKFAAFAKINRKFTNYLPGDFPHLIVESKKSELFFCNSGNKIENRVDSSRKPQIFMCRKASVYADSGKNKKKIEKTFKKVLTSYGKRDNIYLADAEKSQSETSGNA